jgi:L-seryl-tRNA(Ser) seleniumtransferase
MKRLEPDLDAEAERLYRELGARAAINCAGAYTVLGGSRLSPSVSAAMAAANHRFADMQALLASSGRIVAEMLDAEAAYVTAGAAAALTLGTAACLTLGHEDYLERLPDTAGIPNQVVVQRSARQKYDRNLTLAGGRLVEAGGERGMTPAQLHAAIGPQTAAVHYLAPTGAPTDLPGRPPVEAVIEVAHAAGLPVIVDAAGLTYPVDNLRRFTRLGADLVCYAGKYFDAPQSTGLLVGRADLIAMAAVNGFVGFETSGYHTLGRPMKVDRQEIAGCVAALREWLSMDHEARFAAYGERIEVILSALAGLPGFDAYRISERETPTPMLRDGLRVCLESPARAEAAVQVLKDGAPCIWARRADLHPSAIDVSVAYLQPGDVQVVARRLRGVLSV